MTPSLARGRSSRHDPYRALLFATGRNARQRFWLDCAGFRRGRFATDCHRLQPRGSIKAPRFSCLCWLRRPQLDIQRGLERSLRRRWRQRNARWHPCPLFWQPLRPPGQRSRLPDGADRLGGNGQEAGAWASRAASAMRSPTASAAAPRARKLHKRLHTYRTLLTLQVGLNGKPPTCGAFAEPSDGLEPSTPSLPWRCSTD